MRWLMALCLALMLAGCAAPDGGEERAEQNSETSTTSGATPSSSSSSPPAAKDHPSDCEATVTKKGDQYRATCTVSRDFAPATGDDVTLRTGNGAIDAFDTTGKSTISMWGQGDTEAEARDRLASLQLETDSKTVIVFTDSWNNRGASIEAPVGGGQLDHLEASTGNGAVDVTGVTSKTLDVDSGNGAIDIQGSFESIHADTGNGAIDQSGPVGDMTLETGNGAIDAAPTARGGTWTFSSGNGAMDLEIVEGPTFGYDIQATTPNGGIEFELSETEPVGQQSARAKHERTTEFEGRAIQTTVTMTTGNGAIDVTS